MAETPGVAIVMQHYIPKLQKELPMDEISIIIRIGRAKSIEEFIGETNTFRN